MFSLRDKITLVTGAASGIGAAIAEAFAGAGAFVYVTDRNADGARQKADDLNASGTQAAALALDVTDEGACLAARDGVLARHGRLDILVNNAGIGCVGTIRQTSGEDMDRLYAVNVRGPFNVTKAFIEPMIRRRAGVILNMASIAGLLGVRDRLAYTTMKSALVGFTKALALDHASDGIRVCCICPARVETPWIQARLQEYPDPEAARREMCATQALDRMGTPREIAAAALFLASEEAAFITGSPLIIDGGWSAGK
jgi:NAD(P)-dependent dehydrogenase (short-subunit alcohol dehydrogenase family)